MRTAILGSQGLVGNAFARKCSHAVVRLSRNDLDLLDTSSLANLLSEYKIDTVVNCAAKVGGIELNKAQPFNMFISNISIATSILNASISAGVNNLVQFCSNCSYPISAEQPYKESSIFDGLSHPLNRGFAAAKVAALHAGQCAEDEGLIRVFHPIPCSLFGLQDNYSSKNSHFIAAAIRKFHAANLSNSDHLTFWGSGKPYREFMFADHLVYAIDVLLDNQLSYHPINIGTGVDTPIKDIIEYLCSLSKFKGSLLWDDSKPDGAMHKLLDSTKLSSFGWTPPYDLFPRLAETYEYYSSSYPQNVRL